MVIHGKEYKFLYTVRASIEIAKNLPGNNIGAIGKILKEGNQIKTTDLICTMAIAMNRGYLMRQAAEELTEFRAEDVFCRDLYMDLTQEEEQQLENEILEAYSGGNKTKIDTEPVREKNKKKQKNVN